MPRALTLGGSALAVDGRSRAADPLVPVDEDNAEPWDGDGGCGGRWDDVDVVDIAVGVLARAAVAGWELAPAMAGRTVTPRSATTEPPTIDEADDADDEVNVARPVPPLSAPGVVERLVGCGWAVELLLRSFNPLTGTAAADDGVDSAARLPTAAPKDDVDDAVDATEAVLVADAVVAVAAAVAPLVDGRRAVSVGAAVVGAVLAPATGVVLPVTTPGLDSEAPGATAGGSVRTVGAVALEMVPPRRTPVDELSAEAAADVTPLPAAGALDRDGSGAAAGGAVAAVIAAGPAVALPPGIVVALATLALPAAPPLGIAPPLGRVEPAVTLPTAADATLVATVADGAGGTPVAVVPVACAPALPALATAGGATAAVDGAAADALALGRCAYARARIGVECACLYPTGMEVVLPRICITPVGVA